eukprot:TRINITY_DN8751_c0_g5_i1.p1 TRINITY_DN8751_c0_g5~~TRINITY_DN8751_c0_g5_i1.p1  ORF type:complete len:224 (-),score=25.32 TRINITY_DN8751_c0_g5_i1:104-775(-)
MIRSTLIGIWFHNGPKPRLFFVGGLLVPDCVGVQYVEEIQGDRIISHASSILVNNGDTTAYIGVDGCKYILTMKPQNNNVLYCLSLSSFQSIEFSRVRPPLTILKPLNVTATSHTLGGVWLSANCYIYLFSVSNDRVCSVIRWRQNVDDATFQTEKDFQIEFATTTLCDCHRDTGREGNNFLFKLKNANIATLTYTSSQGDGLDHLYRLTTGLQISYELENHH